MKWLKICALLLLTLVIMRASSWAVAWTAERLVAASVRIVSISANLIAFAAFVLFLYFNLLPGEPLDWAAMLFGLIVFVIFTVTDLYWRPWTPRR